MKLIFDAQDIRPLVQVVVSEVLARQQAFGAEHGDRLAYTSEEAATLLGVAPHVIRDCRLRGELKGAKVGKRIMFTRQSLIEFLANQEEGR